MAVLAAPRGDAIEDIAFAIDHVSQHECDIIEQPPPWPRKGGCPPAASPTIATLPLDQTPEPDHLKPVARPSSGMRSTIQARSGNSVRQNRGRSALHWPNCRHERGQLHIGEFGGAGREEAGGATRSVLAMRTPDLGFELSRLARIIADSRIDWRGVATPTGRDSRGPGN